MLCILSPCQTGWPGNGSAIGGTGSIWDGRWLTYLFCLVSGNLYILYLKTTDEAVEVKKRDQFHRMSVFLVLSLFLLFPFGRVPYSHVLYDFVFIDLEV